MIELGRVIERTGDYAIVEIGDDVACGMCELKHSCTKPIKRKIRIPDKDNKYQVGTILRISLSQSKYILAAFLLFILPILFLIGFYFIGKKFFKSESEAIIFSFLGTSIVSLFLLVLSRIIGVRNFFDITVISSE